MTEETMPAQGAGNAGGADAVRPAQSESSPPLPPGLDLLWGRRGRGQRGPKPGLSVDAIVAAAIRIADAEGLEAVSMAHVADQLGFTTMSLYRHVASKEELLQLMWNASAQGAEELVITGDDWRARLRMWAMVQREMIDRHPWITQMPMAAPPMAPNSLTFVERGLEAMDDSGLPDADKLRVIGLISSYTLSEARMAHDAARAARQVQAAAAGGEPVPVWTWEALVREVTDEQTYPRLHRLAWSASIGDDPTGFDEQEEFLFGLDRILDGIEAFIARTRARAD
jgi:AcrR family transcriptional regulator